MTDALINPQDSVERQRDKLLKIATSLMRRIEQTDSDHSAGYAHFQHAVQLEDQVRARTRDLEETLELLNRSNTELSVAKRIAEQARADLSGAIEAVQEGFALFGPDERLVMCNSRFGQQMPDIQNRLEPGLSFDEYVNLVSRSDHLSLPLEDTVESWVAQRLERHCDDCVVFNVRLTWDRWLQVSEHRTDQGGTVILHTDVTDMMRMERQAREKLLDDQARIIRATLDHINQGVCIFDDHGLLMGWNQRVGTLLALPAGQFMLGTRFEKLLAQIENRLTFPDATAHQRLKDWVACTDPRPALSFEVRRGARATLDVFAQETPDRGFVISFTDVTAEREAIRAMYDANESLEKRVQERTLALEDALSQAERANASKSRFVAAASHDLLQPLSAAKLFLSSLEDGVAPPEQVQDTIRRTRGALNSVETILGALLDISKLDAGLAALEPGPVPLGVVLKTLAEEFAPLAARKGLELRILPCSVLVESDAAYLRRILQNLVANAVRYTDEGRILVGARRKEGSVRVEVWDTGRGIPIDEQKAIFREFHRVREGGGGSDGMGLGLAIVERACGLLNHPIDLWSEPGRGSAFFVSLPLCSTAKVHAKSVLDIAQPVQSTLDNMIVLLIENDETVRRAMTLQLEKWGVSVLDVNGPREVDELLGELGILPDLIIADYHLDDGLTGLDLLSAITQEHGAIPSMIVTANRSPELRRTCRTAGISLLYKPLDPGQLHARIMDLVEITTRGAA
ncbi:MAG: PAS-domain containing protein [Pseudomonadota bacterium]